MLGRFDAVAVGILLIATVFSFWGLTDGERFHPDEAYYMTSARHAAINGDWLLLAEPVDKPPLTFYANALALVFFGVEADADGVLQLDALKGEFAGRIPSALVSVMVVAVTMQLSKSLFKTRRIAYFAGILMALSPLRIVFSATAFTDLPMLLFGMLSLWMGSKGNWTWAGIWWAISLTAKPQTIFYLPLILGLLVLNYPKATIKDLAQFILPVGIAILALWGWDILRIVNGADSFYLLGQSRYTTTLITPLSDYPQRFILWWQTIQYTVGSGILTGALLAIAGIVTVWRRYHNPTVILLWAWALAFLMAHISLTINLFDRNQLVLIPIIILLVSYALYQWQPIKMIIPVLCMLILGQGMVGDYPIGGDNGQHEGIHRLADHLNEKPVATVIYDTWLDWQLDYYMGQWTDKRRVFYPTPDLLVADALALSETAPRYFVVPIWVDESEWLGALDDAGFTIAIDMTIVRFKVYELIPPID